jgi:hypothetical protein
MDMINMLDAMNMVNAGFITLHDDFRLHGFWANTCMGKGRKDLCPSENRKQFLISYTL